MPKYPDIEVQLVGEDGNVFSILGRVSRALRKNGVSDSEISEFSSAAMSGDYDNLLRVVADWVEVS